MKYLLATVLCILNHKGKAVHCNFMINQSIHTRLKIPAIRKGMTLKDAIQEAALEYLSKYEKK